MVDILCKIAIIKHTNVFKFDERKLRRIKMINRGIIVKGLQSHGFKIPPITTDQTAHSIRFI